MVMERVSAGPPNHLDVGEFTCLAVAVKGFAGLVYQFSKARDRNYWRVRGPRGNRYPWNSLSHLPRAYVALRPEGKSNSTAWTPDLTKRTG